LGFTGLSACSKPPPAAPPPAPAVAPPPAPDPALAQNARAAQLAAAPAVAAAGGTSDGFVVVPAGTFVMGESQTEAGEGYNDAPQHRVTLTRTFEMQATEVTQAQYKDLMAATPGHLTGCDTCPVIGVSWFQAVTYCNGLSRRRNLPACYVIVGMDVTALGPACPGFRLPTEAEWEHAARAGDPAPRHGPVDVVAWTDSNSGLQPRPVAQKPANAWGLRDMLGNVFEWTADWQGEYPSGEVTDPQGPTTGTNKVFRGGSYRTPDSEARAAFRNGYGPGNQVEYIGFRCVRTLAR